MKSWILASATEFPPRSYITYRWRRAVPLQTFTTRHSNRKWSIVMALSTTLTQYAPKITKYQAYHSQGQQHAGSPTAQSSPLPIRTEITCLHLSWNTVQLCGILTKSLTNLHWSQSKGELPGSQRETTPTSPVCFRCSRTYSGSLSRKGDARSGWHFSSE